MKNILSMVYNKIPLSEYSEFYLQSQTSIS